MTTQFKDETMWLSNFHYLEKPIQYLNGVDEVLSFPTVEHFYVAMKTKDNNIRRQVANHSLKGLKGFGKKIELRGDWEDIKINVMLHGLRVKFSSYNPELKQLLLDTGDAVLQEGNWRGDKYWGVCLKTGEGENNLGKLLMQVRGEIT